MICIYLAALYTDIESNAWVLGVVQSLVMQIFVTDIIVSLGFLILKVALNWTALKIYTGIMTYKARTSNDKVAGNIEKSQVRKNDIEMGSKQSITTSLESRNTKTILKLDTLEDFAVGSYLGNPSDMKLDDILHIRNRVGHVNNEDIATFEDSVAKVRSDIISDVKRFLNHDTMKGGDNSHTITMKSDICDDNMTAAVKHSKKSKKKRFKKMKKKKKIKMNTASKKSSRKKSLRQVSEVGSTGIVNYTKSNQLCATEGKGVKQKAFETHPAQQAINQVSSENINKGRVVEWEHFLRERSLVTQNISRVIEWDAFLKEHQNAKQVIAQTKNIEMDVNAPLKHKSRLI
jgi:hypothetical protein